MMIWQKFERRLSRYRYNNMMGLGNASSVVSFTFDDVPISACKVGAEILQRAHGRATYYVCGGLAEKPENHGFFRDRELLLLADNGHEIGSHGYAHFDYQRCPLAQVIADLDRNDAYIAACGLPAARHFAFPMGL